MLAGVTWWSCWYGQPAEAAGRGAVAKLLVRAAGESSWPGRRGGAAGTGSQRKQLAGALRRDGAKRKSVRKSLPLGERRCGGIEEELAAGRATMRLHRGKACRWARTMQLHQEGAEQHREEAEQHREEAKWQQSALYSIFIPVPQAPYRHSYHNKIQTGRVILRYRE